MERDRRRRLEDDQVSIRRSRTSVAMPSRNVYVYMGKEEGLVPNDSTRILRTHARQFAVYEGALQLAVSSEAAFFTELLGPDPTQQSSL